MQKKDVKPQIRGPSNDPSSPDFPRYLWPEVAFRMAQEGATINQFAKRLGISRAYAGKYLEGYPDIRKALLANYQPEKPHVPASYEAASPQQRYIINSIAYCEYRGFTTDETASALGTTKMNINRWSKKLRTLINERRAWIKSMPKTSSSPPLFYFHSYGYCDTPYL